MRRGLGGGGRNFLNAIIKNGKIQGLGLSTGLQISIPQAVSGMNLISGRRGFGGRVGPPPAPEQGTRSGHSRFLHRLPPLATGVGDVGAATVHGAQRRRLLPGSGRRLPGARDPAATGTTAAAGAGFHEHTPAPPASSPGGGEAAARPEPGLLQPHASRCAAPAPN